MRCEFNFVAFVPEGKEMVGEWLDRVKLTSSSSALAGLGLVKSLSKAYVSRLATGTHSPSCLTDAVHRC